MISLEIENVGSSSDIQVSNVVAVSPSWVWNVVERDLASEVYVISLLLSPYLVTDGHGLKLQRPASGHSRKADHAAIGIS